MIKEILPHLCGGYTFRQWIGLTDIDHIPVKLRSPRTITADPSHIMNRDEMKILLGIIRKSKQKEETGIIEVRQTFEVTEIV